MSVTVLFAFNGVAPAHAFLATICPAQPHSWQAALPLPLHLSLPLHHSLPLPLSLCSATLHLRIYRQTSPSLFAFLSFFLHLLACLAFLGLLSPTDL